MMDGFQFMMTGLRETEGISVSDVPARRATHDHDLRLGKMILSTYNVWTFLTLGKLDQLTN